jgi:hypothetical protein
LNIDNNYNNYDEDPMAVKQEYIQDKSNYHMDSSDVDEE